MRIAVRVDPELHAAIEAKAKAEHRTVSNWIEVLLRAAVTKPAKR